MKPKYHICIVLAVSFFIISSCTKTTNTKGIIVTGTAPDTTIYIAGNIGTNAVLWKNGIPDTLSSTISTANQVILAGTDVYVAGVSQGVLNPTYVSPVIET